MSRIQPESQGQPSVQDVQDVPKKTYPVSSRAKSLKALAWVCFAFAGCSFFTVYSGLLAMILGVVLYSLCAREQRLIDIGRMHPRAQQEVRTVQEYTIFSMVLALGLTAFSVLPWLYHNFLGQR
jgi:hypothetical protein